MWLINSCSYLADLSIENPSCNEYPYKFLLNSWNEQMNRYDLEILWRVQLISPWKSIINKLTFSMFGSWTTVRYKIANEKKNKDKKKIVKWPVIKHMIHYLSLTVRNLCQVACPPENPFRTVNNNKKKTHTHNRKLIE